MLQLSLGSAPEEPGDQGMRLLSVITIIKKEHTASALAGTVGLKKCPQHVSHKYSRHVDQLAIVAGTSLTLLISCSDLTN